MPFIISKKNNSRIKTDAICFSDGPFGDAYVTKEGNHYEIHAGEPLRSFYLSSLQKAKELELMSIAMPLLSKDRNVETLKIATDTIAEFLEGNEMNVYLLVEDKEAIIRADTLHEEIRAYLDQNLPVMAQNSFLSDHAFKASVREKRKASALHSRKECEEPVLYEAEVVTGHGLDERFIPDESFSECLIRMIDERQMSDPEVYKKANIDRKHFNHIKNTRDYRPKKETAVALAIGMKLDLNDTNTLLERAGFVLSRSSKFDLIIRYCIEHQIYNIFDINEILFAEDQKLLGC